MKVSKFIIEKVKQYGAFKLEDAPAVPEDDDAPLMNFIIKNVDSSMPIVDTNGGRFLRSPKETYDYILGNNLVEGTYLVSSFVPSSSNFDIATRETGGFDPLGYEADDYDANILVMDIFGNPWIPMNEKAQRPYWFYKDDAFVFARDHQAKSGEFCICLYDEIWMNYMMMYTEMTKAA